MSLFYKLNYPSIILKIITIQQILT